ncbi:MAG: 4-(cytidine 5'-diphospho)-2-C-methyl-D-erythritol kinase [Desulfobulbaceae bacterium]|nr:4-(cytidine 5'-diphospho)-2-C-methyl-D-erythritol kinase [Desulfobulbaceae bacterium]
MTSHSSSLSLSAPAKINIFLKVLSKRPDGYHELVSWMQKLSLYDLITLHATASGITLQCPESSIPDDESNLAYKAAELFFQETSVTGGVDIVLKKKIPVAAGLGGGSSDAASILNGLNEMFFTRLGEKTLMGMASRLGADVPFFVAEDSSSWAAGVGEKLIKKEPMADCWIILVNPGFSVSTKWVYDNFALTSEVNPDILTRFTEAVNASVGQREMLFSEAAGLLQGKQGIFSASDSRFKPDQLYNDLEKVTVSRYPELAELKSRLLDANAIGALMSGSGPTVFGVFEEKQSAILCHENLKSEYPGNVFLVKPIRN